MMCRLQAVTSCACRVRDKWEAARRESDTPDDAMFASVIAAVQPMSMMLHSDYI